MNSRIYPEELYNSALDDYLMKDKKYCPHCLTNKTTNLNKHSDPPTFYMGNSLFCDNCRISLSKKDLLTLWQVRELKINIITK